MVEINYVCGPALALHAYLTFICEVVHRVVLGQEMNDTPFNNHDRTLEQLSQVQFSFLTVQRLSNRPPCPQRSCGSNIKLVEIDLVCQLACINIAEQGVVRQEGALLALEVSSLVATAAWGFAEIVIFRNTVHNCKLVDRGELILVDPDGRMNVDVHVPANNCHVHCFPVLHIGKSIHRGSGCSSGTCARLRRAYIISKDKKKIYLTD